MSGFEVVGVVLGGFPILLKCLEHYREGFEPLEEWWNFRTHFIAFVDDIRHQMMRYNATLIRLLDPIIADTDDLARLVHDPTDCRWRDGTLEGPLKQRLASEHDRFLRILSRMHEVVDDLKALLQIDNGKGLRIGPWQQKPWDWHFKRMRISFSKGKHKKIRKLAACNQELEEILGYSERIIPIAEKRKGSEPVGMFEKVRQHACGVYDALKRQWRCNRSCQPGNHEAHLNLGAVAVSVSLDVMFILSSPDSPGPTLQQVQIVPTEATIAVVSTTDISHVQQLSILANAQQTMIQQDTVSRDQNFKSTLTRTLQSMRSALKAPPEKKGIPSPIRLEKSVKFDTPVPATPLASTLKASPEKKGASSPLRPEKSVKFDALVSGTPLAPLSGINGIAAQPSDESNPPAVADLCLFLATGEPRSGVLQENVNRHFRLHKLPQDLPATYHRASIDISRQRRFEMATHIASALLQAHTSPWLSERWSKTDFSFLLDLDQQSQSLRSTSPFFSRGFHPTPSSTAGNASDTNDFDRPQAAAPNLGGKPSQEEDARACLFTVGVMILELIFGHNIEECRFRNEYFGNDNKPNDQTDVCTARRWAKKVLGESGANVADAVRRCLDCSFGPRPDFGDVRFRESVYEGVIKPLSDYSKAWPEVMP
ncbi:hypothetical protein C8A00DRAFT_31208 [Chaetomidium leptoderma]|uniref:DUF7580 domain-containing protein n=1 Tax=Chaetomidium leptoderma TaxID=669021 RepID=A0AAN6VQJ6_9PEZI|nr:hypothetical protein C8A00DRAFT_31208 [Chaetomidium leptoderma]